MTDVPNAATLEILTLSHHDDACLPVILSIIYLFFEVETAGAIRLDKDD